MDVGGVGAGVLGGVGECLGDGVVGGDLHWLRRPTRYLDVDADWDGGPAGQRSDCRGQAALGQDGRMQAAGNLAQFVEDVVQPGGYPVQLLRYSTGHGRLGGAHVQGEGHQVLLGAVVQVVFDAAAGGIGGGDDPGPGGGEGGLGLGVSDRGASQ